MSDDACNCGCNAATVTEKAPETDSCGCGCESRDAEDTPSDAVSA